MKIKQSILLLFFSPLLFSQVMIEIEPPENIKTIIFKGETQDQFPIVRLGEAINLTFDDLSASEQDYYYKIVHCDYDWTPSQLLKSQFLDGIDNQRIIDYENSYTTLQPYSNYRLTIPNNEVRLKVTGNYVLEIYNSYGDLQFSRRFVVYKDAVSVGGTAKRARDFDFLNEKQSVQFTINTAGFRVVNPKSEIKIALLQNYYWPSAIYNIKPQFTLGQELVYKYDKETSFFGGNEFLNFDTKDLRVATFAISKVELLDLYHHILFTNDFRNDRPYTYFPDINGDFEVRTMQGDDVDREAEYTIVHFSLPYSPQIGLNNVYVLGKFNNYAIAEENKMQYNEASGNFELTYPFKQGFYNYKYVVENEDGTLDFNLVSGDFHFTENNYTILVYYRDFGDLYDSIIGIGSINSRTITN
ncbi:type IX secretion system plug protein [Croceivirga lutea]|uniref:type IX secretion system plug protein n=1 Tax=Croceivirga lutea TaxID=1775167 RepID=UPI0016399D55|nr:type IX secretion system plug protein domain-containing protein [Croceivirga lutea]